MTKTKKILRYIWLNPVVEAMAGFDYPSLLRQIAARGFIVVSCSTGIEKVREGYRRYLQANSHKPVIDARCPLIVRLIHRCYPELSDRPAAVLPILLVCAQDLYDTYIKNKPDRATLTIVTPCSALAEEGNALFGDRVRFVTWNCFYEEEALSYGRQRAAQSPIPPGFFQFPEYRVLEASGEAGVRKILRKVAQLPGEADLLELLYCQGGCHNGDGV